MKEHIIINKDRTVVVPDSVRKIGIQYDHKVNTLTFDCPRYADDNQSIDLSRMAIYVNFSRNDKTKGSIAATNVFVDPDDSEIMHFDFVITRSVTLVNGPIICLVCAKSTDAEGVEDNHWNSELFNKLSVGEGMEAEEELTEEEIDYITSLLQEINTTHAEVADIDTRVEDLEFNQEKQGAVSEVDLEAMTWTEGSYITGSGTIGSSSGYGISELVTLPKMSTLILDATGYQSDVAMIAKSDHTPLVTSVDGKTHYEYYTDEEIQVYISCKTTVAKSAKIVRNVAETLSDLERENSELKSDLAETQNDFLIVNKSLSAELTVSTIIKNNYIIALEENIDYGNTRPFDKTDVYVVKCKGFTIISVPMPTISPKSTWGGVFYNENGVAIKGVTCKDMPYGVATMYIKVPDDAEVFKTVYWNDNTYATNYPDFFAYGFTDARHEIHAKVKRNYGIVALKTENNYGKECEYISSTEPVSCSDYTICYGFSAIEIPIGGVSDTSTTWGIVFYNKQMKPIDSIISDTSLAKNCTNRLTVCVPKDSYYVRTWWFDNTETDLTFYGYGNISVPQDEDVIVCAFNSSQQDKERATFVCTGTHDEIVLQNALDITINKLIICAGTYNIDGFSNNTDGGEKTALLFKDLKEQRCVTIVGSPSRMKGSDGSGFFIEGGTIINVTRECYDSLSDEQHSIIRHVSNKTNWDSLTIENVAFVLPDNKKKIICIDGWNIKNLSISGIHATTNRTSTTNPDYMVSNSVEGCIGIRGMQGSNYGCGNIWKSSFVFGFYEGYAVSGEHVIGIDLGARYCDYGFTFNKKKNTNGAWTHPITMINCCDECNFNMPYFGDSGESKKTDGKSGRQSINLIDFNMEWLSDFYVLGGNFATEEVPGCAYGNINYTIQPSYGGNSKNSVTIPFWANGHGANVKTINDAQNQIVTSTERTSYAANNMQRVYDITLNKFYTFVNGAWVEE